MPFTFIRSSIFLNPPFFWRYSRMRWAAFGPTPGSDSSCACVAVLRLTGAVGVAAGLADLAAAAGLAAFIDDGCWAAAGGAPVVMTATMVRSMNNARIRVLQEEKLRPRTCASRTK